MPNPPDAPMELCASYLLSFQNITIALMDCFSFFLISYKIRIQGISCFIISLISRDFEGLPKPIIFHNKTFIFEENFERDFLPYIPFFPLNFKASMITGWVPKFLFFPTSLS